MHNLPIGSTYHLYTSDIVPSGGLYIIPTTYHQNQNNPLKYRIILTLPQFSKTIIFRTSIKFPGKYACYFEVLSGGLLPMVCVLLLLLELFQHTTRHPLVDMEATKYASGDVYNMNSGWWFQYFFVFTPIWGRFPF